MSIHAKQSQEAREELRKQKKTSTLLSMVVSVVAICALAGVLALITHFIPEKNDDRAIISPPMRFDKEPEVIEKPQDRPMRPAHQPSSSSSAVVKAMTTTASADINIPEVEVPGDSGFSEMGTGMDIGDAFGDFGPSNGLFNLPSSSGRVAYVIDYSLSMKGKRDKLMREELSQTLGYLTGGEDFSLIFFAGPVWSAGDELLLKKGGKHNRVTSINHKHNNVTTQWNPSSVTGALPGQLEKVKPQWLKSNPSTIQQSLKAVKKTPLVLGTDWTNAMTAAFNLDPLPDTIVFMTDGAMAGDTEAIAKELAKKAKLRGIRINAISLLEPKAKEGVKILAERTGGTAMMVINDGKATQDLHTGEITER